MEYRCLYCGKIGNAVPSRAKKRKYCGSSCQLKYEYSTGKRNKAIIDKAHQALREKGHYKRDNSYLGPNHMSQSACDKMSKDRMGSGNPMHGKTPWNKLTPTKKWWEETEFIRLRKLCLKRDNNRCVLCGESKKDLYCDHIIPYRICEEHKLDNLQMLCGRCHSIKTQKDYKKYKKFYKQQMIKARRT